jgi:poly-gamma-glutamate synthesis protein (capsule biosynthesis protein)
LPFRETAEFLKDADITFANLECTLSTKGEKLINKGIWLRAEPKAVEGLKYADIDIVNIANNHILDYNDPAMLETIEVLEQNNIRHIGAGKNIDDARKPSIIEVQGVRVGFLAYSDMYQYGFGIPGKKELRYFEAKSDKGGIAPLKYEYIKQDIQKLRNQVDLLAVSLHWGVEDSHHVPHEQRELAHKIMDDGVDIILGHHPHELQGIEIYKGKPIVYSMGNFIFDQNHKDNNESMIVDVDFVNGEVVRLEVIPLQIVAKKQTVFAKGQDAEHIMEYLKDLSQQLNTKAEIQGNKLRFNK